MRAIFVIDMRWVAHSALYLLLALFLNASTVQQSSINMNADANQKLSKWEVASKAFETDTPTFSQRMIECKEEAKSECG